MKLKSHWLRGILGVFALSYSSFACAQVIDDFESGTNSWSSSSSGITVNVGIAGTDVISGSKDLTLKSVGLGALGANYTLTKSGMSLQRQTVNDQFSIKYKSILSVNLAKSIKVTLKGTEEGSSTENTYTFTQDLPLVGLTLLNYNWKLSNFTPSAANLSTVNSVSLKFETALVGLTVDERIDDIALTKDTSGVQDWNVY